MHSYQEALDALALRSLSTRTVLLTPTEEEEGSYQIWTEDGRAVDDDLELTVIDYFVGSLAAGFARCSETIPDEMCMEFTLKSTGDCSWKVRAFS